MTMPDNLSRLDFSNPRVRLSYPRRTRKTLEKPCWIKLTRKCTKVSYVMAFLVVLTTQPLSFQTVKKTLRLWQEHALLPSTRIRSPVPGMTTSQGLVRALEHRRNPTHSTVKLMNFILFYFTSSTFFSCWYAGDLRTFLVPFYKLNTNLLYWVDFLQFSHGSLLLPEVP